MVVMIRIEIWKTIAEDKVVEHYYQVSNLGRVRVKSTGQIRKAQKHRGYMSIVLWGGPEFRFRTFSVHYLVMNTFRPLPIRVLKEGDKPMVVNHIDFNKENNLLENLEWVTQYENIMYSRLNGRYNDYGENSKNSKYSEDYIRYLCTCIQNGTSNKDIYKTVQHKHNKSATYALVNHLRRGNRWRHVSKDYF